MLITRTVLFCSLLFNAVAIFAADHRKVSEALSAVNPESTVDVIVQFKNAPTEAHHRRMQGKGAQHQRDLGPSRCALYTVKAASVASLADDPDVAYVTLDQPVHPMLDYSMKAVNADMAVRRVTTVRESV